MITKMWTTVAANHVIKITCITFAILPSHTLEQQHNRQSFLQIGGSWTNSSTHPSNMIQTAETGVPKFRQTTISQFETSAKHISLLTPDKNLREKTTTVLKPETTTVYPEVHSKEFTTEVNTRPTVVTTTTLASTKEERKPNGTDETPAATTAGSKIETTLAAKSYSTTPTSSESNSKTTNAMVTPKKTTTPPSKTTTKATDPTVTVKIKETTTTKKSNHEKTALTKLTPSSRTTISSVGSNTVSAQKQVLSNETSHEYLNSTNSFKTSTSNNSNYTAEPGGLVHSWSESEFRSYDSFWPIATALTIGIPTIIVFAVTITVLYRGRMAKPRSLLSMYGQDYNTM